MLLRTSEDMLIWEMWEGKAKMMYSPKMRYLAGHSGAAQVPSEANSDPSIQTGPGKRL